MVKRLLKTIPLENGLTLEFHDASKPVAGDRWRVSCIASLAVPVDHADAGSLSRVGIDREDLADALDSPQVFEKVLERNFVDEKEKAQVMDGLCLSMAESLLPYVSRSEFPGRFLARQYMEHQKKVAWRRMAG